MTEYGCSYEEVFFLISKSVWLLFSYLYANF